MNYRAKVWLNGVLLGEHEFGYVPFELPTTGLVRDGVNRLVVRVDNRRTRADIPRGYERPNGRPGGGWWNYGGILREVYLRRFEGVDVESVQTETEIADSQRARVGAAPRPAREPRRARARASGSGWRFGRARALLARRSRCARGAPARSGARSRSPTRSSGSRARRRSTRCASRRCGGERTAGRLPAQRRHPRDPRDRRRPAAHQRPPREAVRREHPRGARPPRRRAHAGATASATCSSTASSAQRSCRAHYPLHPQHLELADRMGVMVWDEVPVFAQGYKGVRGAGRDREGARVHPGDGRARPKPPVGAGLEHRQRALRADDRGPGGLHPPRGAAARRASTRPGCARSSIFGWPQHPPSDVYHELDALGINSYFGWYPGPNGSTEDRQAARPVPRPDARVLPRARAVRHGVRRGVEPQGTGRPEGHVRVPARAPVRTTCGRTSRSRG